MLALNFVGSFENWAGDCPEKLPSVCYRATGKSKMEIPDDTLMRVFFLGVNAHFQWGG